MCAASLHLPVFAPGGLGSPACTLTSKGSGEVGFPFLFLGLETHVEKRKLLVSFSQDKQALKIETSETVNESRAMHRTRVSGLRPGPHAHGSLAVASAPGSLARFCFVTHFTVFRGFCFPSLMTFCIPKIKEVCICNTL